MLEVGAVLGSPIHDSQQRLLLGAGITITRDFLLGLHRRGVRTVAMDEKDLLRFTAFSSKGKSKHFLPHRADGQTEWNREATNDLDASIDKFESNPILPADDPYLQRIASHGKNRYEQQQVTAVLESHQAAVSQVGDVLGRLAQGKNVAADAVHKISHEFLMQAAEDLDLFVSMGINPVASDSIFAHSTNVATLAVAIGATLGLDEAQLCDLGTGCLVHDAGMMYIDRAVYQSDRILQPHEFAEIAKHPIISADLLYKKMTRVPLDVRMVVYQMHERCDGSGYPRGWKGDRIHPLAKIAAVADAYVALVSERPHRPAMLPYHALVKMLQDVRAGLFDSTVVRGLLNTIALFPIGSYVEVENGQVGRVIRSNGPAYDKPILEAWEPNRRLETPEVIDLAERNLCVVRALTSLH